jgi:hypothetical protein
MNEFLRLEVQVSGDAELPAPSGRVRFNVERLSPMNARVESIA